MIVDKKHGYRTLLPLSVRARRQTGQFAIGAAPREDFLFHAKGVIRKYARS